MSNPTNVEITITNQHAPDLDRELADALAVAIDGQTTEEAYKFYRSLEKRMSTIADNLGHELIVTGQW